MKKFLPFQIVQKISSFAKTHKFIAFIIGLVVVGVSWWGYSAMTGAEGETRYVLGMVEKGTIVASISASGQVSASNQVEIQPKASGEIIYVGVKEGQSVKNGAVIAQIDSKTAQKSVRDAEANLESAQIALEKLKKPASALTVTQAQNALANAQDSLTKLYSDGNTHVINVFLDIPSIITSLEDILIDDNAGGNGQWNMDYYANGIDNYDSRASTFKETAHSDYLAAKKAYDTAFVEYQALGNKPDNASIEKALTDSYTAVQLTAKALKSTNALVQLYVDIYEAHDFTPASAATTALTNLNTYTGTINSHLTTLLSDTNSLKQYKQSIVEKQQSLDETLAGADSLDVRSSELSVIKAQNALQDAKNTLADYFIRAPFDGIVASLDIQKGQTVGSAAVATLITNQKVATLSVNEVDAAQIKVGDKATLSFDAIEDLTLTGEVVAIDTIGTVTQGVVSYELKVVFDSQDERIKSGMTANAAIQTDTKQDVLVVSSSAVKTQNGVSYVQVFDPPLQQTGGTQGVTSAIAPRQIEVVIGIADDTNVEIVSGLEEGQQVVTRTISGATASASTATGNAATRGGGGLGAPGGGSVFIPR